MRFGFVPGTSDSSWVECAARAWVAKLVDAPDSKSGSFTGVSVRFRPQVPHLQFQPLVGKANAII